MVRISTINLSQAFCRWSDEKADGTPSPRQKVLHKLNICNRVYDIVAVLGFAFGGILWLFLLLQLPLIFGKPTKEWFHYGFWQVDVSTICRHTGFCFTGLTNSECKAKQI